MKKKIVINESISGYLDGESFGFAPGSTQEISVELAVAWVASGIASWAPKEPKVAPKAEFAVAKAPEVSKPVAVSETVAVPVVEAPEPVVKAEDKKEG